ncbi:hypothetical protein PNP85_01920 [Halobacterium salinarum]|uniref:hypothetical protein n=1 Tax=Halobacterium salinarum TaxID=2242 RepID=UPI002555D985|nr:hypothetical protein [Halobacterium salinarum]MDL0135777.1 hypothetical protein [Halobacterium salinarum]MDL0138267.1 hypothetical protein [Halobacterium salinarum]
MQRRALLTVAGTALIGSAGCISLPSSGDNSDTPTGSTTKPEATTARRETLPTYDTDEVQRQIFLESVDDVPDEQPVAIEVELLNGTVTGRDPARVRATVTNTTDEERHITRNEGECALFDRGDGASESPGLHLHRPGFPGYRADCRDAGRVGDLWRLDLAEDAGCVVQAYGCVPGSYDGGESQPETYQVWDDFREPGYMAPGSYRFETAVTVGRGDDATEFQWGFSITVERPT